jgi:hypothetical protein
MRTTVTIDDRLVEKAKTYSGIEKVSELLEISLKSYIATEAASRLAALGGSDPFAEVPPRRGVSLFDKPPISSIVAERGLNESAQD